LIWNTTQNSPSEGEAYRLFDVVSLVLNRGMQLKHGDSSSVALLRVLVEAGITGIGGDDIGERLRERYSPEWARRLDGQRWLPVELNRLRTKLQAFRKSSAGAIEKFVYVFKEGTTDRYCVVPERNFPDRNAQAVWLPHVWNDRMNFLVITEPVMFRDPKDTFYLRIFAINDPTPALISKHLPKLKVDTSALVAESHYVSLGEVRAMREIENGLRNIRSHPAVKVTFTTNQEWLWEQLAGNNFVLTGTWRANEMIREFQKEPRVRYRLEMMSLSINPVTHKEAAIFKRA